MSEPSLLMEYFLSVLSPLLAIGALAEPGLARRAAAEALSAWQARGPAELMLAGQITGLAVAALDDLRLSALAVSVSLALKLRGNAAALNRAGQAMTAELRRVQRAGGGAAGMDAAAAARDAVRRAEAAAPVPGSAAVGPSADTPPGAESPGIRMRWLAVPGLRPLVMAGRQSRPSALRRLGVDGRDCRPAMTASVRPGRRRFLLARRILIRMVFLIRMVPDLAPSALRHLRPPPRPSHPGAQRCCRVRLPGGLATRRRHRPAGPWQRRSLPRDPSSRLPGQ